MSPATLAYVPVFEHGQGKLIYKQHELEEKSVNSQNLTMRHHCCSKQKVKRGLWSPEEDEKLVRYIARHGHGCWSSVPKLAGLQRCGKSCRLRWINYLRPDLKRGTFTETEERVIIDVHRILGNRWAQIARHLPGRTDNEVKNFWNSCIKKKLIAQGLDPRTHNLMPSARPSCTNNNSSISGGDSRVMPSFSQFSRPLLAAATATPFTISTPNLRGYDTITTATPFAATLPQDPVPLTGFQYQDPYALTGHNFFDYITNLPPPPAFNPSQFVDESCVWGGNVAPRANGLIQPLQVLVQGEVQGLVQPQLDAVDGFDMSYDSSQFDLGMVDSGLMTCGGFSGGSSIEQMPWD